MVKKRTPAPQSNAATPSASTLAPSPHLPSLAPSRSSVPVTAIRRPKKLGFFMKYWIWYESSFAISMLETWEKIVLHVCGLTLLSLFSYAVSRYLPHHIEFIGERAKFYLFG